MFHSKMTPEELEKMSPKDFRQMVRSGEWKDTTLEVCHGYAQLNLVMVPKDFAFEFLLFCNRNPSPCPVVEVIEPGNPHPKEMASETDLRTDIPKYRVWRKGELIDEPNDVIEYWQDDLVIFLLGCSRNFIWGLRAANISCRRYGPYPTTIPCVPAGRFHGNMVVTVWAFANTYDAVRAVQISSRHPAGHGPPVYMGDPESAGIHNLGAPDPMNSSRPVIDPPKPDEIIMCWGCGITPQYAAIESKIPFMITHAPSHMFVTDRLAEELSIL